jgi:hypothetical protein
LSSSRKLWGRALWLAESSSLLGEECASVDNN